MAQEFILAKELLTLTGFALASWADFIYKVPRIGTSYGHFSDSASVLYHQRNMYRYSLEQNLEIASQELLQMEPQCSNTIPNWLAPCQGRAYYDDPIRFPWQFRDMACQDRRDRVYAICGLLRE